MEGIAQYQLDAGTVFCLTDGEIAFDADVFPAIADDLQTMMLAAANLQRLETQFNVYVFKYADGHVDLVDTGGGALFGSNAGHTPRLLQQLAIGPDDINRVIFTHLHGDHCGGTFTGDNLTYPEADVIIHSQEAAHWQGTDTPAGRLIAAYGDRVRLVADQADLGYGMHTWALGGHTPGHMGLRIADLALVGDIIHSEALQLPNPNNRAIYDVDSDAAYTSRIRALSDIADHDLIWSGSHILGPDKFAKLKRDGAGFMRVPL